MPASPALQKLALARLKPAEPEPQAEKPGGGGNGRWYVVREGERIRGNWLLSGPWHNRDSAERDVPRCRTQFGPCRLAPASEVNG